MSFFSGIYGKNLSQQDIDNVYDEKEAQKNHRQTN